MTLTFQKNKFYLDIVLKFPKVKGKMWWFGDSVSHLMIQWGRFYSVLGLWQFPDELALVLETDKSRRERKYPFRMRK